MPIKKPFRLYHKGHATCYDTQTLWTYICVTGDTRDPLTRRRFARHELLRLERCGNGPLGVPHVLHPDSYIHMIDFLMERLEAQRL